MRLPGRIAAAIAVLADIDAHKRPVAEALKAWGLGNRFAGAGDRAAIGNLVYDALRRRSSHAFAMGSDTPRALVLSVVVREWGENIDELNASFEGDRFAPAAIEPDEVARLTAADPLAGAPDFVRADVPEWVAPHLAESFGEDWVAEAHDLSGRPPLDLRVNTLKANRDKALRALGRFAPEAAAIIPEGIRFPAGERDSRTPNVQSEEGYIKGWFEVQDFGSQIVAALAGARGGEQVLDLCAGAGGKTLAMAAAMQNRGQIFAYDSDRTRLAPIYDRLKRAGARNVQVRAPGEGALDDLVGKLDRVVVDAPCTGTGTWRRQPTAKWKLTPEQLAGRVEEQRVILIDAARYLKPGGTLVYITCSVLPEENARQASAFLEANPEFTAIAGNKLWMSAFSGTRLRARFSPEGGVSLTPRLTGTDGFYCIAMERSK
ncbi:MULTISPECIES: RsmB/NOP family class I SAM-dependent RNA methyltransferase [unclassified Devosia]|jgi:16S rRNA (cytosine967-C5)-methyltransferase|uniref:RsmB/NOP family class I SAM-dependent RNA methyltransferase n=1 Tax=unclassified Devosia TaxID=196773 RepID=UPI00086B49DA|nr:MULTISPECIES: RsmB/NOP family class I SAM-dependent RNA methyltransferase [unclassified Devosia]MBN9360166.1 RsmB/NOP family class I SAM-dependent RNA methyltransferase [Devosia sp.]ODS86470.1 MAG: MFS transporter [Devosia sp. SCN 66-27]OJX22209.1 MAG: MFS transporter [Devosia sp. 66-14]